MPAAVDKLPRVLAVFDFDWSLINHDSDYWVVNGLAPEVWEETHALSQAGGQWTDLMDRALGRMHQLGITREQIEQRLDDVPVHPGLLKTVELLSSMTPPADLFILSDANTAFIDRILRSYKIRHLFRIHQDEGEVNVITNRGSWEKDGTTERLRIERYIRESNTPHGCRFPCAPNICKGQVLDKVLAQHADRYNAITYVGDGANDFCPATRLAPTDILFARIDRTLTDKILSDSEKRSQIHCNVVYWHNGSHIEGIVSKLVKAEDSWTGRIPGGRKGQTMHFEKVLIDGQEKERYTFW